MPDTENDVQGNDVQQELMDMIIADAVSYTHLTLPTKA